MRLILEFRNLSIGKRLGLGFSLILVALAVNTGIGIYRLQTVANATRAMMDIPLAKERMISDWQRYLYGGIRRTIAIAKSSDPSLPQFFADDAASSTSKSMALAKSIEALPNTEAEKSLLREVKSVREAFVEGRDSVSAAKLSGDRDAADRLLEQRFLPSAKAYEKAVQAVLDYQRQSIDTAARDIETIAVESRRMLILLAMLVVVLGVVFAWVLTASITEPIGKAVRVARRIAQGDLTDFEPFEDGECTRDEAGLLLEALGVMKEGLVRIVRKVRSDTDGIASACTQIAAGNTDLSMRTAHQASSLEETAASMEQIASAVTQNADRARQANALVSNASNVAVQGGEVVSRVVHTMKSIRASATRITDIISVIDGIAFQTNILALNAAVEAARAGEQGRGFAVVAGEVRSLAQRSAESAKEIKALIEASVGHVESGNALVSVAGTTMDEVASAIKHVVELMGEITSASDEQSSGILQVNTAVAQMDEVTQQNAALVEQAAAAGESLQQRARDLAVAVSAFRLD